GALLRRRQCHPRGEQGRSDRRHRNHRHRAGACRSRGRAEGAGPRHALGQGKSARSAGLDAEEKALVRDMFLITMKPLMYIANVAEDGFENNPHLDAVRARAVEEGAEVVPVCAAIEEELSQMDDADRVEFLESMGFDEPGLNRVIRAGYK